MKPDDEMLDEEEASRINQTIFNRVPTAKEETNDKEYFNKLGDDMNHDIGKSNEYFVKIKSLEYLSSFLTICNIANCMILYEIDYDNNNGENDEYVDQQLNLSTFFSLTLTVLVNFRFYIELKWKKSNNFITQNDNLWTAGMVKWMIFETALSVISPHSIFKGITYTERNTVYN